MRVCACWLALLLQDMQATGGGGSKKESLEDWLDGF
jgi:hypothetical protein